MNADDRAFIVVLALGILYVIADAIVWTRKMTRRGKK